MRSIFTIVLTLCSTLSLGKTLSFDHWQTANGIKVYYVKAMQVPMLDIKLAVKAGSAYDGKDWGLAKMTNELLNQKAGGLSATQLAENLENNGAIFQSGITRDMATVSLRSLSDPKKLTPSLHMFKTILTKPEFDKASIARTQSQLLTYLKHQDEVPATLASKTFYATLYGEHPYAHSPMGSDKTIKNITADKIKRFYQTHYVSNGAVLTIVGAISKKEAKKIATDLTKHLSQSPLSLRIPAATPHPYHQKNIPSSSNQTIIRIGQIGIRYDNPYRTPLIVGNYTLGGGGLVSRLAEEIREKRGLSYNISSYFLPLEARGPFMVSLATQAKQTKEALRVTRQTLNRFVRSGPTDKELVAAKKYLNGSFPLRFLSNKNILDNLTLLGFYDLPDDYFDTYLNKVNHVSKKDIQTAFQKQLKTRNLLTIVVGQS